MTALIASIDLAALQSNFKTAQNLAPGSRNFAVIKANAYGHGSVACAKALEQAGGFAVATIEEAVELRQHGIKKPILILSRFSQSSDVSAIQEFNLLPVIHSRYQLELLIDQHRGEQPINAWLKIDTGMNRLGFDADKIMPVVRRIEATHCINAIGLMSHLACADETDNEFTQLQLNRFNQCADRVGLPLSLANSAAIIAWPGTHKHWNRPGLMLYGASPLRAGKDIKLNLQPVMNLTSKLISIAILKKGEGIGYAHTFKADKQLRVGIVACGYADGYPRRAGTDTPVLVCDRPSRLLGRVSMDTLAVDLSCVPDAQVGSNVELWGSKLPVNDIARHAGTIAYELFTGVSTRVPRVYVN